MSKILIFLLFLVCSPLAAAQLAGKGLTKLTQVHQAADFILTDLDSKLHRLSDSRGHVVIVNFWATWCPPCRAEMPSLQSAWEQLKKQGIQVLGIDVGEDEETIFQFTANYPVEFPLLLDKNSRVINQWGVVGLPTTFVINPEGQIIYRAIGGRKWDDPALLQRISALQPR